MQYIRLGIHKSLIYKDLLTETKSFLMKKKNVLKITAVF